MPVLEGLQDAVKRRWEPDLLVQNHRVPGVLIDIKIRRGRDPSDDPAIIVTLMLSEPPAGQDTWPTDEIWESGRSGS
jgi:hypothetical protein